MTATTLTRAAACAGSSAAALMPTGKPSAVPSPQTATPATATTGDPPNTASATPDAASSIVTSSTGTRPHRSSAIVPKIRPNVIVVTNTANTSAPIAGSKAYPSMNATATQSFAVPSVNASTSTSNPI